MDTLDAVWLALALAGLVVFWPRTSRKSLFAAVLTKGRKGSFGLSLTPVKKKRHRRRS